MMLAWWRFKIYVELKVADKRHVSPICTPTLYV